MYIGLHKTYKIKTVNTAISAAFAVKPINSLHCSKCGFCILTYVVEISPIKIRASDWLKLG